MAIAAAAASGGMKSAMRLAKSVEKGAIHKRHPHLSFCLFLDLFLPWLHFGVEHLMLGFEDDELGSFPG